MWVLGIELRLLALINKHLYLMSCFADTWLMLHIWFPLCILISHRLYHHKLIPKYNFAPLLFLAMQEEALKLVLLALEDGSALSRKVLVLFVVQRLEPRFPQASKTSIGHVVQLLYRASCFKVSTIQLSEDYRFIPEMEASKNPCYQSSDLQK